MAVGKEKNFPLHDQTSGLFLEGPAKLFAAKKRQQNLKPKPKNNGHSLHKASFRRMLLSVFRYRLLKEALWACRVSGAMENQASQLVTYNQSGKCYRALNIHQQFCFYGLLTPKTAENPVVLSWVHVGFYDYSCCNSVHVVMKS